MRSGASIVNITSISGLRASALRIAYGTSKAALEHLTKQLALGASVLGIRVNAVAPGPVDTAMAKAVHSPAIRADYHDAIPLGRYGLRRARRSDFFLCSERASYITGQTLAVDGGFDAIGIGLPTFRKELQVAPIERWRNPPVWLAAGRSILRNHGTQRAPAHIVRPRRVQRQWTPVPHRGPRARRARAAGSAVARAARDR